MNAKASQFPRAQSDADDEWICRKQAVGVRYVRGGTVVSSLEIGILQPQAPRDLEAAVRERLFQLRVQLVGWEGSAARRGVLVQRLRVADFDGAPLSLSRKGRLAAELRDLAARLLDQQKTKAGLVPDQAAGAELRAVASAVRPIRAA